jgi:nucleotide-binding universal stress UspA family protein
LPLSVSNEPLSQRETNAMTNSQDQELPKLLVAVADRESSHKAIQTASSYARALNAELILVNVLGDPHRVGVVAELIESDLPVIEAKTWLKETIDSLAAVGVTSSFLLLRGEVGAVIVREAVEQAAQVVFLSTTLKHEGFEIEHDPIAHYVIEHCPTDVYLVRQ